MRVATPSGFEPPISTLTGWRVRPLHHGAVRPSIGIAAADGKWVFDFGVR